jgi:oligopeptide/dipeptide ABC transporter, ATP-binding protein, C-terminal domain
MNMLLEVSDLKLYYRTTKGVVKAVDRINFGIERGETLALVGESGCGKSSMAKAIIRLLPRNIHTYEGSIIMDGMDIMKLSEEEFRRQIRWRKISMVFQGALNALNPVLKVGYQVAEPLIIHNKMDKEEALKRAREMLKHLGIAETFADRYSFELSGGMRQRVVIAMALITNPELVILDEPTSSLDVITQANIMNLLKKLKAERRQTFMLITHDMALASELADKVATMYAGQLVELAKAEAFYERPLHPYTQKLMRSVPTLRGEKVLESIPGAPPNLINPPSGCRFHPRCDRTMEICRKEEPPLLQKDDHMVKCWLYR